ncbi:GNAT family N-acetyltransferase [Ruegeria sediminis]|uniref:GNAT family N-acetyltransferase n=1 Tax=Ruegeria sediminis TaxID=2583820 RepID=UPI001C55937A|nr:GNAT family N-acetyltransferase [Ruegeria sediminis]
MKDQWTAVYEADPEATYFLSFEWLFGTATGAGSGGMVVGVRAPDDDSDYVAFLPVRLNTAHESGGFHNELNLSGNYTSDYNGFICRPEFETQAIPALAKSLLGMNWRRLRLLNLPASDERVRLFLSPFSARDFDLKPVNTVNSDGIDNAICPHAVLADDWDEFLQKNVSSNTRQKIRRFLRQVEGSDAYRFTHTTGETFDRDLEILIELWTERWAERKGERVQAIVNSFRRTLRNALETQTLFMPMLWHEDRPLCAFAILVDDRKKTYNFIVGGRDDTFKGPPTGLVLHAYAIRHAISQGIRKYDFLRGNEPYKYAFGSEETKNRALLLSTKSGRNLRGKLDRRCLAFVARRSTEFYRAGDLAAAERGFAQLVEAQPDNANLRYWHGVIAAKLGDDATASREFETSLERNPASLKTWLRLGRSLISGNGGSIEAANSYVDLMRKIPDQQNVHYLLGRVLLRLDQVDQAVAVFEAASRLRPGDADILAALEKARRMQGKSAAPVDDQSGQQMPDTASEAETKPAAVAITAKAGITPAAGPREMHRLAFQVMNWRRTETAVASIAPAPKPAGNGRLASPG